MTVDDCVGYALQDGLQEKLNQLEQGRISLQRRKLKIVTGLLLLAAVTMAVMVFVWRDPFSGFFMLLLILLGGFFLVISKNNTLLTQFKQTVIPQLLRIAIPGLRYDCEACLSSADFCNTRLFRSPDRYNGKDLFTGSIGKTRLYFSMVHAEERHETTTTDTDSDGHTTTRTEEHWYNIFQGLFFMADFNKHFSGHTVITSGAAGLIAGLSSKHVLLEDPRFNQSFTVYASDQVEARYLLTPSLMELLLKLEARLGSFQVSFVDSWINIAASLPYNYFEPDLKVPLNNIAQVKQILYAIYNVVSIVDTLDLNTRIWSKE